MSEILKKLWAILLPVVMGIIRNALAGLAGWLLAKGYITEQQGGELTGALLVVIVIGGTILNKVIFQKKITKALYTPVPDNEPPK